MGKGASRALTALSVIDGREQKLAEAPPLIHLVQNSLSTMQIAADATLLSGVCRNSLRELLIVR